MKEKIIDGVEYGIIRVKLREELSRKKISINKLSKLTGIKYDVIKRYFVGNIYRIDLDVLAKICYVLECDIENLLEYSNGENR